MRRNGHGRFSAWMPVPGPWMTSIGCLLAAIWSWPKSIRGNACSGWPRRSPSGSRTRTGPSAPLAGSANLLPAMCARGSRIAVRCRRQDGTFAYGVLICSLSAEQVLAVLRRPSSQVADPVAVLAASVTFYDQRGGGIETSLKGDKQGLGLTKRNKKRFEAQQMVMLLGSLTHNTIIWARRWLAAPQLRSYGMLRMVRDIFHISGFLGVDARGQIVQIGLNPAAPLASVLVDSLQGLLAPVHMAIHLDKHSLAP